MWVKLFHCQQTLGEDILYKKPQPILFAIMVFFICETGKAGVKNSVYFPVHISHVMLM